MFQLLHREATHNLIYSTSAARHTLVFYFYSSAPQRQKRLDPWCQAPKRALLTSHSTLLNRLLFPIIFCILLSNLYQLAGNRLVPFNGLVKGTQLNEDVLSTRPHLPIEIRSQIGSVSQIHFIIIGMPDLVNMGGTLLKTLPCYPPMTNCT